jgi:hypothetical protein
MASLEDMTVDQLLAHAKRLEAEKSTFQAIVQDPAIRESFQRGLKKLNPSLAIPELDAKDAVRDEIKTEREARIKLENDIRERDIRARLEKQRADIKSEFKLSDEEVLEVEKLMTREADPIPSYRSAAQVFRAMSESAKPTPAIYSAPTYDMPEKDVWGKGLGNKSALDKIAMNQAFEAWNEIASGKVPGLGAAKH